MSFLPNTSGTGKERRPFQELPVSFFKNASIRTKILSLILPLCIVGLGAAAFMATRYKESDALYSEFIGSDNAALVELARANRNLIGLAYGAYQVMAYDANAAEINVARQAYSASKRELLERLGNVKAVFPEERAAVDVLIAQSQSIAEITDKAVELGMANKNAESAVQLVKADASIQIMSATITTLLDKLAKGVASGSDDLSDQTNSTILTSLVVVGVVFAKRVVTYD